jgi:hypothetical protein
MNDVVVNVIFIIVGMFLILFAVKLSAWFANVWSPVFHDLNEQIIRKKFNEDRQGRLRAGTWVLRGLGIFFVIGGSLSLWVALLSLNLQPYSIFIFNLYF